MESTFDTDAFLNMQVEGENSTSTVPIPVGEYQGLADAIGVKSWQSKDDPDKAGLMLNITWLIEDEGVKSFLERDTVKIGQTVFLDLTENGTLDMGKGKNVQLGRLREALNLNQPGVAFSFNQLQGQMAKVSIDHGISETTGDPYHRVKGVARLS